MFHIILHWIVLVVSYFWLIEVNDHVLTRLRFSHQQHKLGLKLHSHSQCLQISVCLWKKSKKREDTCLLHAFEVINFYWIWVAYFHSFHISYKDTKLSLCKYSHRHSWMIVEVFWHLTIFVSYVHMWVFQIWMFSNFMYVIGLDSTFALIMHTFDEPIKPITQFQSTNGF